MPWIEQRHDLHRRDRRERLDGADERVDGADERRDGLSAPERQGRRRVRPVCARAMLGTTPEAAYRFLADVGNHHRLTGRGISLLQASGDGAGAMRGRMLLSGPLRIRRQADTAAIVSIAPALIAGMAVAGGTEAVVRWDLQRLGRRVVVELSIGITRVSVPDRILLGLGGRWWIRRLLRDTLRRLAGALGAALVSAPAELPAVVPAPVPAAVLAG